MSVGADRHAVGEQRPSAFRRRRRDAPAAERPRGCPRRSRSGAAAACRRAREGAQRMERVVGDDAFPHEIPQRVDRFARVAAAGRLVQRREERRAVPLEVRRRSPARARRDHRRRARAATAATGDRSGRARRARRDRRPARRRARRLRRPRRAHRDRPASSRRCAPRGSRSRGSTRAAAPPAGSRSRRAARRGRPRRRTSPCHVVTSRASTGGSTGSTSLRSFASERRRIVCSTSGSHHSRPAAAGTEFPFEQPPACRERLQQRVGRRSARARSAPRTPRS